MNSIHIIIIVAVIIGINVVLMIAKIGYRKINKGEVLTGENLKKIAISGLYSMQQNASVNTLRTGMIKFQKQTILAEWWGIFDSNQARETLERLLSYANMSKQLFLLSDSEIVLEVLKNEKLLNADFKDKVPENSVQWKLCIKQLRDSGIISEESEVLKITPLAWDLGRTVFIARLCFEEKLISEEEAWYYINCAYSYLPLFSDWMTFSKSYIIGRTMWDVEEPHIGDFKNYSKKLLQSGNIWNKMPIHD